jgi:hypothetical protein
LTKPTLFAIIHAMREQIAQSILLISRTMPLMLIQAGLSISFGLLAIPFFFVFIRLAAPTAGRGAVVFPALLLLALLLLGGGSRWIRRHLVFIFRAAHIALMTEFLRSGKGPSGRSQFRQGQEAVARRFGSYPRFVDFQRKFERLARTIRRRALPRRPAGMMFLFRKALVAQMLLAYPFYREDPEPLDAAREGFVLFAGNAERFFRRAAPILIFHDAVYALLLLILSLPICFLFQAIGLPVLAGFGLAAILALMARQAFVEPLVLAALIVTFIRESAGKTPDPVWEERLAPFFRKEA